MACTSARYERRTIPYTASPVLFHMLVQRRVCDRVQAPRIRFLWNVTDGGLTEMIAMNASPVPNLSCPSCRSPRVYNSEYDGMVEEAILRIVDIFPFACQACGMRFYMFSAESMARHEEPLHEQPAANSCEALPSPN